MCAPVCVSRTIGVLYPFDCSTVRFCASILLYSIHQSIKQDNQRKHSCIFLMQLRDSTTGLSKTSVRLSFTLGLVNVSQLYSHSSLWILFLRSYDLSCSSCRSSIQSHGWFRPVRLFFSIAVLTDCSCGALSVLCCILPSCPIRSCDA